MIAANPIHSTPDKSRRLQQKVAACGFYDRSIIHCMPPKAACNRRILYHRSYGFSRQFFTRSANILLRNAIAADKAVTYSCNRTELNRHRNTNILRNGKNAGTVLYAAAYFTSRNDNRRAAAFGDGRTSLRKGRNSYRNTNRGRLLAYSRTSLRFIENIGICINHNKWFPFLAVAIFILCAKSQHVPRAFMFCKPANKAHRSKMPRPAHSSSGYYAFIRENPTLRFSGSTVMRIFHLSSLLTKKNVSVI